MTPWKFCSFFHHEIWEAIIFYSPVEAPLCYLMILGMLLKKSTFQPRTFFLAFQPCLVEQQFFWGWKLWWFFPNRFRERCWNTKTVKSSKNMIQQGATAKDANLTLNKDGVSIFPSKSLYLSLKIGVFFIFAAGT